MPHLLLACAVGILFYAGAQLTARDKQPMHNSMAIGCLAAGCVYLPLGGSEWPDREAPRPRKTAMSQLCSSSLRPRAARWFKVVRVFSSPSCRARGKRTMSPHSLSSTSRTFSASFFLEKGFWMKCTPSSRTPW